jgi:hypothetical protein
MGLSSWWVTRQQARQVGEQQSRRARGLLRRLEGDPGTQYAVHKVMARVWIIMTPIAIAVCVLAPAVWLKVSIIYVVIISHYANWASDAGVMSAADAATDEAITEHARENGDQEG